MKSCNCSDVCDNARSRDCISVNLDEQIHLRYVSLAVPQNWSMHVKYASRHAWYCASNVFDCIPMAEVAARAGRDAVRDMFVLLVARFGVVVLRADVVLICVRLDVFVVLRDVAFGVREIMFVPEVRDVTRDFFVLFCVVVVRAVMLLFIVFWVCVRMFFSVFIGRVGAFTLRSAALAMPTLTNIAPIR